MRYLKREYIIFLNRKTIERHGGQFVEPYNILKSEPLDYVVECVQAIAFGQELYPEIHDKAAVYMFSIISNHVFQDGNKRTGLECALLFLELNNHIISNSVRNNDLLEFTLSVADGSLTLDEVRAWFKKNVIKIS